MISSLRQLFLLFFVLLQGVAPLLHAHAMPSWHGGLHMPVAIQPAGADDSGPAWQATQAAAEEVAIGLAGSLQPRHDCPCSGTAALPAPAWALAGRDLPHGMSHPPDRQALPRTSHVLPYPCAPPRLA